MSFCDLFGTTDLIFALKKAAVQWIISDIEHHAALRSPFLPSLFSPPKSSADMNPVFHFECSLFQPVHHSHLHRRFPLWNWIQKLIWDSSTKLGGSWGGRDGAPWVGPTSAGAFSNRVEALLLHPPLSWQGQGRNCTGRLTAWIRISCAVVPGSCCSPCKGSAQRLCHASPQAMTAGAGDFYAAPIKPRCFCLKERRSHSHRNCSAKLQHPETLPGGRRGFEV